MNYYQDITLNPDDEVLLYFLWTKVFTQLHLALAEEKRREGMVKTALSFPTYQNKGLGNKVRVLALETEQLNRLNLKQALIRLLDYIDLTKIKKFQKTVSPAIASTADISQMNSWREKHAAMSGDMKVFHTRKPSIY